MYLLKLALFSQADANLPAVPKLFIHPLGASSKVQVDIVLEGLHRDALTIKKDLKSGSQVAFWPYSMMYSPHRKTWICVVLLSAHKTLGTAGKHVRGEACQTGSMLEGNHSL